MPKQNTASVYDLRTLCNQNGLSCRDSNGKYLPKSKLIKLLQTGGDGNPVNLYYNGNEPKFDDKKLIAPIDSEGNDNDEFNTLQTECQCISPKTSGSRHYPAQCYVSKRALRVADVGFDDLMSDNCRSRKVTKPAAGGIKQDHKGRRWYRICAEGDVNCNIPGHPAGSKPEDINRYGVSRKEQQYYENLEAKATKKAKAAEDETPSVQKVN